jgi:hypothetical protein
MKSYLHHLPSQIEYQKLQQSHQILEDQLKQSNQTVIEYRKEKTQLKKQLISNQQTIDQQQQQIIKSQELSADKVLLNAKCLTIDERIETEKKFEEFHKLVQQLSEKLNEEKITRKRDQHLNENNIRTVQSLSNDVAKKEQTIREMTSRLRQVNTKNIHYGIFIMFLIESTRISRSSSTFTC